MQFFTEKLRLLVLEDESGAVAIEYGILVALIGLGMVLALESVRNELRAVFDAAGAAMKQ
jgi:pilus assembly protein Flp/PilA